MNYFTTTLAVWDLSVELSPGPFPQKHTADGRAPSYPMWGGGKHPPCKENHMDNPGFRIAKEHLAGFSLSYKGISYLLINIAAPHPPTIQV